MRQLSFYCLLLGNELKFVPAQERSYLRKSNRQYSVQDLIELSYWTSNLEHDKTKNQLTNQSFSSRPVHLITQWYYEEDIRRRNELVSVLHMNLINEGVQKIHFIQPENEICTIEKDVQIAADFPLNKLREKIVIKYLNRSQASRLTIEEALLYGNSMIKNSYAVLLNLDIFFDRSLLLLQNLHIVDQRTVFYLSRYEIDSYISTIGPQCVDRTYVGSHDALLFIPPLPVSVIHQLPFELGTWNVEVKIIYELIRANYTVRNVCKSIRAWHLHSSQIRHRLMPSEKLIPDKLLPIVMRRPEYLSSSQSTYSHISQFCFLFFFFAYLFRYIHEYFSRRE